jgi:hypothetical protein
MYTPVRAGSITAKSIEISSGRDPIVRNCFHLRAFILDASRELRNAAGKVY